MTRNKKIILSIIFIIVLYFIYKVGLLYLYNYKDRYPSYNEVINSIEFTDTVDITKGNNLKDFSLSTSQLTGDAEIPEKRWITLVTQILQKYYNIIKLKKQLVKII